MHIKLERKHWMAALAITATITILAAVTTILTAVTTTSSPITATYYYVATNGDDGNPGTETQPFRTINKGVSVVQVGDTLYVRAGTYHEQVVVSGSGTAADPITLSAYPGERPVIDGQNSLPPGAWGCLFCITGNYIVVDGLEVSSSTGFGVRVSGNYNKIHNLDVHHSHQCGITVMGNHNLVEACSIWSNSMVNEDWQSPSSWCAGLSAKYASHATFRNNTVYNNWGEGIPVGVSEYITIEDNVVYDNFSANIYINLSSHVLVQRNLVYSTGDPRFGIRSTGIACADEDFGFPARCHHITIINNLVLGGNRTFYYFKIRPESGLKNSLIAHNTFVNSHQASTIQIERGIHEDTRIENNISLQEDSLPVALVADDPELHFSHNLWSKTPPSYVSSPDDVIGNPQLAKSGPTGPGLLTAEWFQILASSPALERAKVIAEVQEDFFRNARGSPPDIGAHESPQEAAATATRHPSTTPTASSPIATPTASSPIATPTASSPIATPTASSPTATPTASSPTATPTASSPTATPTASSPTATPPAATSTPGGHWYDDCPPDPPTRTPWPVQPTYTPRPTYTPAPLPTCRPTATLAPNPSPTPYPTATYYPTSTPYPPQP